MATKTYFKDLNLVSLIWFLTVCPAIGHAQKAKQLTVDDYGLWNKLSEERISDDGKWISFKVSYESGADTLFVKSPVMGNNFTFPKASEGQFNGSKSFAFMMPEGHFQSIDLKTGLIITEQHVEKFAFTGNEKYLVLLCNEAEKMSLKIMDGKGKLIKVVTGVTAFSISPDSTMVAFTTTHGTESTVEVLHLDTATTLDVVDSTDGFKTLVWDAGSRSLSFVDVPITTDKAPSVFLYRIQERRLFSLNSNSIDNWPESYLASCSQTSSITISDDGKRLFFKLRKSGIVQQKSVNEVRIWNAADRILQPSQERAAFSDNRIGCWWPDTNKFMIIGGNNTTVSMINGDQKFAVTYDSAPYLPTVKFKADRDYYIINLESGVRSLFLKQQFSEYERLKMSPDGQYVYYFREGNWWTYNFYTQHYYNLTEKLPYPFLNTAYDKPEAFPNFGLVGCSKKGDSVLLYDQFDIWKVTPGKKAARLTNGREKGVIFRIAPTVLQDDSATSDLFRAVPVIEFEANLLFEARSTDDSHNGLYVLKNGNLKKMVFENKKISDVHLSKKANALLYKMQGFNSPPSLMVGNLHTIKNVSLYRSNPQHNRYDWGKSKILTFTKEDGVEGTANLFYPFDYNPSKSYPMIVHIYEDQSLSLNLYVNPTLYNLDGYNVSNFTSNGYFVLNPNIKYTVGNPGHSATETVIAATKAAIATGNVDPSRVGLIGHSFGGFESLYIITKTNIFSAAVAGAGVVDLTSFYHSISKNYLKPETWRMEYDQWRIGKPLYGNEQQYFENSPITNAENLRTPLLTWAGDKDLQIDPYQTMEFYVAMRRLEKEHVMLRYPEEQHVILDKMNMKDLTVKIMQWFDYYLKGHNRPTWTIPN